MPQQVDAPVEVVVARHQVLHQEGHDAGVRHGLLQAGAAPRRGWRRPARRALRMASAKGVSVSAYDTGAMSTTTSRLDALRVAQRQRHRRLAAHAVAHHRGLFQPQPVDQLQHVVGHLGVVHRVGPGRGAVVAQVHAVHACACAASSRATPRQLPPEPNRPCSTSSGGPLPTVSKARFSATSRSPTSSSAAAGRCNGLRRPRPPCRSIRPASGAGGSSCRCRPARSPSRSPGRPR